MVGSGGSLDSVPVADTEELAEAELFEGLDADALEDVLVSFCGLDADVDKLTVGGKEPVDDVESSSDDVDMPMGDPPSGVEMGSGDSPLLINDDADSAMRHAEVSGMGYVSCSLSPWDVKPNIGRITTWPKEKAYVCRSISATCYLHIGCKSPARLVWSCSEEVMLKWLLSGVVPRADVPSAEKKELGVQHRAMFEDIWKDAQPAIPDDVGGASPAA